MDELQRERQREYRNLLKSHPSKEIRELLEKRRNLHFYLRTEENSYFFGKYVLNFRDFAPKPHHEMCHIAQHGFHNENLIENVAYRRNELKQIYLIAYPRWGFKTTNLVNLTVFSLKEYPWLQFLITKADKNAAIEIVDQIKSIIIFNKIFRERYGDWQPTRGLGSFSSEAMVIQPRLDLLAEGKILHSKDPSIATAGVDAGIAGGHFDIIHADDLHNERNYQSKELTQRVIDHLKALLPVLNPWGIIFIWCTKWTDFDAYDFAIKELKASAIFHNCYNEINIYEKGKLIKHQEPDGKSYFPSRVTLRALEQEREQTKEMFNAWYLLDPVPEESIEFPLKYKQLIDSENLPQCGMVGMSVDTTYEQGQQNDYQVIAIGKRDYLSRLYVLWLEFFKLPPEIFMERVFQYKKAYGVTLISCEDITSGKTFLSHLEQEMRRRHEYAVIRRIKRQRGEGKIGRIRIALKGRWANSLIIYVRGWDTALIDEEMTRFPIARHLDGLDTLADLVELPWGSAPKEKISTERTIVRRGYPIEPLPTYVRRLPVTQWQIERGCQLNIDRRRKVYAN
jgi:hypothetical protein